MADITFGMDKYSSSITNLVTAGTATDFFTIQGSATRTVYVTNITISGTAAAGTTPSISIIKRSAANTGGTSATATNVPLDTNASAATAVVKSYTVNPTGLGAAVGTIFVYKLFIAGSGNLPGTMSAFDNEEPLILRGTSEFLCLNLNSTSVTTPQIDIVIAWGEE